MKVHYLQHVPFEDLSSLKPMLINAGHQLSVTHLYANQQLPSLSDVDWLIVMGGPMGIYDDITYPWLNTEKAFIKAAIKSNKIILGICLGAQLIADSLGAKVYKNTSKEIGWHNLKPTSEISKTIFANVIPTDCLAFHWHGDTFDIPVGATNFVSSDACKNQGFIFNNRVLALQFHLETSITSATALIDNCEDDLDNSQFVQSAQEILEDPSRFLSINQLMQALVTCLENNNN